MGVSSTTTKLWWHNQHYTILLYIVQCERLPLPLEDVWALKLYGVRAVAGPIIGQWASIQQLSWSAVAAAVQSMGPWFQPWSAAFQPDNSWYLGLALSNGIRSKALFVRVSKCHRLTVVRQRKIALTLRKILRCGCACWKIMDFIIFLKTFCPFLPTLWACLEIFLPFSCAQFWKVKLWRHKKIHFKRVCYLSGFICH